VYGGGTILSMADLEYDALADRYAAHRTAHAEVVDALARRLGPGSHVLEAGCGTGNYVVALQEATGAACFGVDPSEEMLAVARSRSGHVEFTLGTAERLPFADRSFDLVFSVDVIHHVVDRPGALREAFRVLRSGGRLCIGTEDEEMIRGRLHAHYFPETVDVELARYPAVGDLRSWMSDAGFVDVEEERTETMRHVTDSAAHRDRAFSSMHLIPDEAHRRGLERLERDLARAPIDWPARQLLVWSRKP
jgi:SAM-dependent methyltransferase